MNQFVVLTVVAFALAPTTLSAQTQQPYVGFESRPIKALSNEQLADLRAGRGMGLALAAELNGYPGPSHVLELAEPLGLSDAQRTKMQEFFAAMKAETVPIGEKLIAQETDLDRQFARKTITEAKLVAAMQEIGNTQAVLRAAHLKYHLATAELLAPIQIQRYVELRGYASGQQMKHQPGRHQHQ